ncbi:MAG: fucose isomerase [Ignavibacteria bacterium]|nr:fucose isomerase [Ignavibacteria bacterium]
MHDVNSKYGYISIASSITQISPNDIAADIQTELFHHSLEHLTEDDILADIPIVFLVLTGGTEQKILGLWQKRREKFGNEPIFLLAHPGNNSLPAALEVLARIHQENVKGKIIYLDTNSNKDCWKDLDQLLKHYQVYYQFKRTRVGLIGSPSDWLVASQLDFNQLSVIWGAAIEQIELEELKTKIANVTDEEIEDVHYTFLKNASEIKEPKKKELKQVVKVYAALKKLVEEKNLQAVSVRCFDLVTDLNTTGCFALAKLNDDGITAGCEGDIVSTIGMIWANYLTNQTVWMANPAKVDEQNNSILLAHCTVPIGMTEKYKLRTHFESGLGVGIQGEFSKGKATVFRLGGKNMNKIWISNAEILQSTDEENLCRTQLLVKLHGSAKASDLLTEPLGNHLLLMRGTYSKEMLQWWEMFIN